MTVHTPLRMCIGMSKVDSPGWRYSTVCSAEPVFTVADRNTGEYATRVPTCQRHLGGVVKNMLAKWGAVVVEPFPNQED